MDCVNKRNPVFIKCPHDRYKYSCKDCNGASICIHNRRKSVCKECGGASICIHNRQKSTCKDCGGGSICIHNRIKTQCKDCNNYYCKFCEKKFNSNQTLKKHNNATTHMKNYIQY